jgi:glycosyltransferase involved in cell wall biosynthesis
MISLCLICRNDSKNVARLITEARPYVSEIICVDTGSIDDSVKAAQQAGADVVRESPELLASDGSLRSFSEARQLSYALSTKPWQLWLDTDDTLSDWSALSKVLSNAETLCKAADAPVSVSLWYDYSWTEDRKHCIQSYTRERLVHRDDHLGWRRPIHEYIKIRSTVAAATCPKDVLRVVHLSQGARGIENDRNLKILKRWELDGVEEDIDLCALYYYLGDEYFARENYNEAYKYFSMSREVPASKGSYDMRAAYRAGLTLIETRNYTRAAAYFSELLASGQHYAQFYWELSRAQALLGASKQAKETLKSSAKKEFIVGENPLVYVPLARYFSLPENFSDLEEAA